MTLIQLHPYNFLLVPETLIVHVLLGIIIILRCAAIRFKRLDNYRFLLFQVLFIHPSIILSLEISWSGVSVGANFREFGHHFLDVDLVKWIPSFVFYLEVFGYSAVRPNCLLEVVCTHVLVYEPWLIKIIEFL